MMIMIVLKRNKERKRKKKLPEGKGSLAMKWNVCGRKKWTSFYLVLIAHCLRLGRVLLAVFAPYVALSTNYKAFVPRDNNITISISVHIRYELFNPVQSSVHT